MTIALHSIDSSSQVSYSKPPSYSEFLTELDAAHTEGDKLAQQAIERLAPEMAKELEDIKNGGSQSCVLNLQDADTLANPDPELPAKLIQHVLDSNEEHVQNFDSGPEEYSEAVATLITDMIVESHGSTPVSNHLFFEAVIGLPCICLRECSAVWI